MPFKKSTMEQKPGTGVLYELSVEERKSDKAPPWQGYMVLDRSYNKGDKIKLGAWIRPTSRGTQLVSLIEDRNYRDWVLDKREKKEFERNQPREIKRGYAREDKPRFDIDDSEIPY